MLISPLSGQTIGVPSGDFVIAEWTDPGCPADGPMPVAPIHLHRSCDEAWYVLEGRLVVLVGEEEVLAPAGSCVFVPKGTKHTYWNPDPTPTRYLLVMTSKTQQLIDAIHSAEDRSWSALKALFEDYDSELIG